MFHKLLNGSAFRGQDLSECVAGGEAGLKGGENVLENLPVFFR